MAINDLMALDGKAASNNSINKQDFRLQFQ